jgi:hypothetical protein
MRLPHAEQIEVRAVEDHHSFHGVPFSVDRLVRATISYLNPSSLRNGFAVVAGGASVANLEG